MGYWASVGISPDEPLLATASSAALTQETLIVAGANITLGFIPGNPGQIIISSAASGAPLSTPQYLTLAPSADLANERVFTPGTGLAATDGGAGGAFTLNLPQTVSSAASPTFSALTVLTGLTPLADNTGEVGTDLLRWSRVRAATVVAGDLELRDDERRAHWTIREEADSIQVINRKTGKRYALVLEEA